MFGAPSARCVFAPRLTASRRNALVILAVRAIVFPLAAGNIVVFKSSELSPRTHFLVAELFRTAGFPAGTVNLLGHSCEDAPRITEALIRAPAVRKVNFTGRRRRAAGSWRWRAST